MKNLLLNTLLLITIPFNLKGQADTTFILRELNKEYYHAIFIEKNPTSKYFLRLSDFSFTNYDSASYKSSIEYIKGQKSNILEKHNIKGLQRNWAPLYLYKEQFYLYAPSDWGYHKRIIISDSTFVYFQMDGTYGLPIKKYKKVSDTEFNFSIENFSQEETELRIYIIDATKGIAIFEDFLEPDNYRYQFMVAADKMNSFPIIVNHCLTMKQFEFDFQKPDINKYLKK